MDRLTHTHGNIPFPLTPVKPPQAVVPCLVGSGLKTIAITAIPRRFHQRNDVERWPAERENFSPTWVGPSNPVGEDFAFNGVSQHGDRAAPRSGCRGCYIEKRARALGGIRRVTDALPFVLASLKAIFAPDDWWPLDLWMLKKMSIFLWDDTLL